MLRRDGDRTEMVLNVELPEGLSEKAVQEWLSLGIKTGWRDTVDRLAAELASTAAAD